jgi:hypothetical protein
MQTTQLLALQFSLSLAAYAAIGWVAWPWLRRAPLRTALSILLLPQLFRHVGISLLVPEVVDPGLPVAFARQTAIGDTLVVGLAWVALIGLRARWPLAIPAVWSFNVIGLADLLFNLATAARLGAAEHLGAAWYGPAFVVPGMVIVHVLIFAVLMRADLGPARRSDGVDAARGD